MSNISVATLTLNPSLDKTMYFEKPFCLGVLNRAKSSIITPGSKGINVSRVFGILGIKATAFAFSGGDNGRIMEKMLKSEGIPLELVKTKAQTRLNIKMIDSEEKCTEANETGGPITEDELDELIFRLKKATENTQLFALGGSIPQGVDKSVYYLLTKELRSKGAEVVLDCDGAALKKGIEARPSLIKPNLFELSELVGYTPESTENIASECKKISVDCGINILCTLSENGAIYTEKSTSWYVTSPHVTVNGFTGAGDTFLSAFLYEYKVENSVENALLFASSAAAAKVELPGTCLPDRASMEKYVPALSVKKI